MRQGASDRFHVQVDVGDDVVQMRATGEIDVATVGVLRAALWAAPARPLLRLDLSGVRLLSAAGVRALIAGHRRIRACGGELVLVDPTPMIAKVLQVTGLDRVIPVRASTDADSPAAAPLAAASQGPAAFGSASRVPAPVVSANRVPAVLVAVPAVESRLTSPDPKAISPALPAPRPLALPQALGSLVPVAEATSAPLLACA